MPNQIGYVDNTSGLAHYAMLDAIRAFCAGAGWTILRNVNSGTIREVIMSAPGYTGPDGAVPAFVGIRTYHDVANDYYNLLMGAFTGYVAGNTFDTQPGARLSGVPAHNNRIDYWLTVNDRRLVLAMKVGTPVYESAYLGYCLPYGTPLQFPYPLVCAGMLAGAAATRFSEVNHSMPYKGNTAGLAPAIRERCLGTTARLAVGRERADESHHWPELPGPADADHLSVAVRGPARQRHQSLRRAGWRLRDHRVQQRRREHPEHWRQ